MKVLIINETCGTGSHGRICGQAAENFDAKGYEVKIAYGRSGKAADNCKKYAVRIGNFLDVYFHALFYTRLSDRHGFGSKKATKEFLKWADNYQPELLWLHNLHGYYINVEYLFSWIKQHPDMEVRWTLHDCWPFTGHCIHFLEARCSQWEQGCFKCPQKRKYPASFLISNCRNNYARKRDAFTGVKNMKIIVPSQWLAGCVGKSFLKGYNIQVVPNKIDTEVFRARKSSFRKQYGLEGKIVILGAASVWTKGKGFDDFIKLADMLDEKYTIVLAGRCRKYKKCNKQNVIILNSINDQKKMAKLYSACDWFVNMTYEDNYPTVNLEAQACGTPVVCYDVGGCKETLHLRKSKLVACGDIAGVCAAVAPE